jgi:hypothetical protein
MRCGSSERRPSLSGAIPSPAFRSWPRPARPLGRSSISQGTTKTTEATKGWGSEDLCRINRQYIGVRRGRGLLPASSYALRFTCKCIFYRVGLPGLEPGTSSLSETKACVRDVRHCPKLPANRPFSLLILPCAFTAVQGRCRQTVVNTLRYRAGKSLESRSGLEPLLLATTKPLRRLPQNHTPYTWTLSELNCPLSHTRALGNADCSSAHLRA